MIIASCSNANYIDLKDDKCYSRGLGFQNFNGIYSITI